MDKKIPREELLAILKTAQPALSSTKNQVAELSHLWFSGKSVSAFDDVLGIQVAFETDFTGGIPGEQLIGVLERSGTEYVEIERDDDSLLLIIGRADIRFAAKPFEDWFWEPNMPDMELYEITGEFLQAIDLTLLSVGTNKTQSPEQRGITIIQNGNAADFFSTDATSMSWIKVPTKNQTIMPTGDRCIVPTPFCEQLLKISRPGAGLLLTDSAAYCTARKVINDDTKKAVDVLLYSKLVDDPSGLDFMEFSRDYAEAADNPFPVPTKLPLALDRALVLLEEKEAVDLGVTVDGGERFLTLSAIAGSNGSAIDDRMRLDDDKHPKIKVKVDAARLRRGLDGRESMTICKDYLVMLGPGSFYHIVGTK